MAALSALAAYDDPDDENFEDEHEEGAAAIILKNNVNSKTENGSTDVVEGDADVEEATSKEGSENGDNVPEDLSESEKKEENEEDMIISGDEGASPEKAVNGSAEKPAPIKTKRYSCENATALAAKLKTLTEDDICIPPEPEAQASSDLQEKIRRLFEKKIREGENLNEKIQSRKDFRNPSIYDKLILFLGIEERGTNFPKEDYDPDFWRKCPTYEDLARAQREEMAKKDKEKKTKVEFVTGTAKKPSSGSGSGENPKRTKWDRQDDKTSSASGHVPGASVTASSTGSKPTIISAVGTIKKTKA